MSHETHEEIVKRLKRVSGHLAKVIEMIEADEPCVAVAQQLQAISSALVSAKRVFVQDHIDHCLDEKSLEANPKKSIAEFKEIAKYL